MQKHVFGLVHRKPLKFLPGLIYPLGLKMSDNWFIHTS